MTDYLNGFHYENKTLRFFATAEGYVDIRARSSDILRANYVYNYTDHLGNIRVSYAFRNATGQAEIMEENHYYPFGLKHKKYGSVDKDFVCVDENCYEVGIDVVPPQARKPYQYKYNGKEFQDELGLNFYDYGARNYDPAIGRWINPDPLSEEYRRWSPYNYVMNSPLRFVDPDGMRVSYGEFIDNAGREERYGHEDDITVNSQGVVTNVVKNDQPNRFFDQKGNPLNFNDIENTDKLYTEGEWRKGDRVYYPISESMIKEAVFKSGLINQRQISKFSLGPQSGGYYLWSLFSATKKGHGTYDFAENYLAHLVGTNSIDFQGGTGRTNYQEGAVFFRFGSSNTIYNIYDGGNYMWARAMRLSGFSYKEIYTGSHSNSILTTLTIDSEADQRAIKNGFYGN